MVGKAGTHLRDEWLIKTLRTVVFESCKNNQSADEPGYRMSEPWF